MTRTSGHWAAESLEETSKERAGEFVRPGMPWDRRAVLSVVVIALLAPGQGSQTPGMLAPWLDDPGAEETLAAWSDAIGLDLRRLGTDADADEIKDTAVTQPLVVAAALLAAARLAARSAATGHRARRGPLRRRAGRRRHGRGAVRRRRRGAGRRARPRDGRGVRAASPPA